MNFKQKLRLSHHQVGVPGQQGGQEQQAGLILFPHTLFSHVTLVSPSLAGSHVTAQSLPPAPGTWSPPWPRCDQILAQTISPHAAVGDRQCQAGVLTPCLKCWRGLSPPKCGRTRCQQLTEVLVLPCVGGG